MKRNASVERALKWSFWYPARKWPQYVAPPQSVLRCKTPKTCVHGTTQFRVGYYSRQDGPNCVWLVRPDGECSETWDQVSLFDHFDLVSESDEWDVFGINRPRLGPLA